MKVKDYMNKNVENIEPDTKICEVAKVMLNKHIGCMPVCDGNKKVIGLVTDRDLILRSLACDKDTMQTPVREIMTTKVYSISPDAEIIEASKIMCDYQIRRLPVIENDMLVGIITLGDLANNANLNEICKTVKGICNCNNYENAE